MAQVSDSTPLIVDNDRVNLRGSLKRPREDRYDAWEPAERAAWEVPWNYNSTAVVISESGGQRPFKRPALTTGVLGREEL